MMQLLRRFLKKSPRLHRIARRIYGPPVVRFRVVPLSRRSLPATVVDGLKDDARYNNIIDDLVAYTGFSAEQLIPYLLRAPRKHFQSEFNWYAPKSVQELTWFYRCSAANGFANAIHPYAPALDVVTEGHVLDFGAGVGCNTIGLAKRGLDVDFLEIGHWQADFINFRAERHKLKNVREVRPFHDGRFDPLLCIREHYDAIVAMDVLEHIPDNHVVLRHLIERLKPGGLIVENSPFDRLAPPIALHLRPGLPLEEAMVGMVRIDKGTWKKHR